MQHSCLKNLDRTLMKVYLQHLPLKWSFIKDITAVEQLPGKDFALISFLIFSVFLHRIPLTAFLRPLLQML